MTSIYLYIDVQMTSLEAYISSDDQMTSIYLPRFVIIKKSGYTDFAYDFFYSDFFLLSKSVVFRPLDSPNRFNKASKSAYILGSGCRGKKVGLYRFGLRLFFI